MARVERILVVVAIASDGASEDRRFAVLDDGRRIEDPGFGGRGGCSFGFGRLSRADHDELRQLHERAIREADQRRGPAAFAALAAALHDAGVDADPPDLAALPLDVEFEEVESLPPIVPTPEQLRLQRRARIAGAVLVVVVGAIWPSLTHARYRAWRRHSWRRRILGGVATWGLSTLVREAVRPRR